MYLLLIDTNVYIYTNVTTHVRHLHFSVAYCKCYQAFCSTITGTITTQAIMKGFGVGDAAASALGATITWVLRDGVGMVGRIAFAWWKG